jgi:hypothetical protein
LLIQNEIREIINLFIFGGTKMISIPLSSSELGNLWQAYREKAMMNLVLDYLIEKAEENETKKILHNI